MDCKVCGISCPSDYQYQEHIAGKKHALKVAARTRLKTKPTTSFSSSNSSSFSTTAEVVSCYCGLECSPVQTQKPGANFGRFFFSCPKYNDPELRAKKCKFFKWEDSKIEKVSQKSTTFAKLLPKRIIEIDEEVMKIAFVEGKQVHIEFKYQPLLVNLVKTVHPVMREYCPLDRKWILTPAALRDLLYMLETETKENGHTVKIDETIYEELKPMLEEAEKREKEAEEKLKALQQQLKEGESKIIVISDDNVVASSSSSKPQFIFGDSSLVSSPSKRKREYSYDSDSDDEFLTRSRKHQRTGSSFSFGSLSPTKECGCGRPHLRINNKHICKYFGHFECSCGNKWKSANCWEGEAQACQRCNRDSYPYKKEKLKEGAGIGECGPHDESRCGMCRRLGRRCC